jgi:hypothetical protein
MFEVLLGENEENHKGQPGAQSRLNLHTSWIQVCRVLPLNKSTWKMGLSGDKTVNYMVWNNNILTLVTGLWWTVNVWNSCGPWPTVSGCCTITRTVPELVPYAISIQLPHKPNTHVTPYHKDWQHKHYTNKLLVFLLLV